MSTTPKFDLPLLTFGQSTAFVPINEAATLLEFGDHHAMDDATIPPGDPAWGDTYIILGTGTGEWAGHNEQVAVWLGKWFYFAQPIGSLFYDVGVVKLFLKAGTSTYAHARTGSPVLAALNLSVSNPPTQAEVEAIQLKLNTLLQGLRQYEIMASS